MRRRDAIVKGGVPSADLLVCFPHRAHLTVMPTKAICSPTRPLEHPRATTAPQPQPIIRPHHRRSKSSLNGKVPQASPVLWVKTKHMTAAVTSEPTSPKVTCVGQIKVQTKNGGANPCKGWKSFMHEIEQIHKDSTRKKRPTRGEALGFNKDVMQFLTCIRSLKFNFRCFGNFPEAEITSDDEEEDNDEEEDDVFRESDFGNRTNGGGNGDGEGDTKFSKWVMVLQEDPKTIHNSNKEGEVPIPAVPPPNALLLMRCRSAPAKSWLVNTEGAKCADDTRNRVGTTRKNLKILIEEEKKVEEDEERKKEEGLVTASYDMDYYRISTDVAQETWIVGGFRDILAKSRSWKI